MPRGTGWLKKLGPESKETIAGRRERPQAREQTIVIPSEQYSTLLNGELSFALYSLIIHLAGRRQVDHRSVMSTHFDIPNGLSLRTELSLRGMQYAALHKCAHERTSGFTPGIVFGEDEAGLHGNFLGESYQRIRERPSWSKRLQKTHTAYRRARARADWHWRELDCASSSDALLMNIFCFPGITALPAVSGILGTHPTDIPEFGFKPRTPLRNGRYDNTEVDMKLASLLVEAKLTETSFQLADPRLVHRYHDFEDVFDSSELSLRNGQYSNYQLIRGILAAYATNGCFSVFCDARRPDLIEQWYRVLRAVRSCTLRCNLKLLTWQELSQALPSGLQDFLDLKYGIRPS